MAISRIERVQAIKQATSRPPVRKVGPDMLDAHVAWQSTPTFYRNQRAQALWSAAGLSSIQRETGRNFGPAISLKLATARALRAMERA